MSISIRPDEIDRISIDKFTSASGLWLSILCERFEPHADGLRGYYIVICNALTRRVRKIYRIAVDDKDLAHSKWEDWKVKFGSRSEFTTEEDAPTGLSEIVYSWPIINEEDQAVLKMKPRGARLFVRDITPIDEVSMRAEAAGLAVVIDEANKPRPTMGIVLAIGEDPLAQELYKVGQIVMFGKHSGNTFMEAGQMYRSVELHEIIGVREAEDGLEDLLPTDRVQ